MKKNQGFSLIELIVVIAIMAILVGVLAPAYLRYVEKSRRSNDVTTISELMGAAEKVASEAQYDEYITNGVTFTIQAGANGAITLGTTVASAGKTKVENAWKSMGNFDANTVKLTAKAFKAKTGTVTGTVGLDGNITWAGGAVGTLFAKAATDGNEEGEYFCTYSPDFKKRLKS